ncbi:hypothetical protein cypCar_00045053 [Cyprinus carpio]|nr:hypothetical protein cypCar_00045053 [Cyprinus carpio]
MILEMFREDISNHSILIFSHADRLRGESIERFVSKQNQKVQDPLGRIREAVSSAFRQHKPTKTQTKKPKIIEGENASRNAERTRKVKQEVKKMADARWREFFSYINEERQETERRRKRIQRRIDQIEKDIKKEEQNVRPIPERLARFTESLQTELENMGRLEDRRMEEERERKEREEREQNDLEIWIQEDEQRRLSEGGQNNLLSSDYNKMLFMLTMFMLGIGASFAPALLPFLFPAAPAVETGFAAGLLTNLLAAEGWGFVWVVAGVAKAAVLTRCSIQ